MEDLKEEYHEPISLSEPNIHVELTYGNLDASSVMNRVKRPDAGAVVLFAGTTRSHFQSRQVVHLSYSSYGRLAIRTMLSIAKSMQEKHSLNAIVIIHRLGTVPIGEESILIAVSSPHRQAAWRGGEETLEIVKEKVEIWKREIFEDGGIWRANRDGAPGVEVQPNTSNPEGDGCTQSMRPIPQ